MNSFWALMILMKAITFQAQTPAPASAPSQAPAQPAQNRSGQAPTNPGPVTAFPNTPKARPSRVKDIPVPPPPLTPGSQDGQSLGDSAPLTAEEAVRIALHQQPSLGVQTGAFVSRQGQTIQIGAAEHPQVSISAGYDKVQSLSSPPENSTVEAPNLVTPAGASPVYPYSATASAKQLIFDFNMTRNLVKQSEALERSALEELSVAQLTLALNVKTDFYNYVSAIRTVHVNEENLENRQRQLDLANSRFRNGIGEPSDLATAQTSKSQGIFLLNQARNNTEHARISLLQQMGIDPLTPVIPLNEGAPEPRDRDARSLTNKAIKIRPEVKSAFESLVAAKYGLSAAKAVSMPSVYAEVGGGLNGSSFPLQDNVSNFAIGLQFPIVDGGTRAGEVKAAKGQILTATANYQTALLQVRTDVANAYMDLKSAEQRVGIADNEVYNAREDVRVAEGRYQIGIGLFQDITTAQSLLLSAQTDQESARNSLDLAKTTLQRATGELIASLL